MDDLAKVTIIAGSLAMIAVVGAAILAANELNKPFRAGVTYAKDKWDRLFNAGGAGAQGWLFLLGSTVYNPSRIVPCAYDALVNNSAYLFEKHGSFGDYFNTLSLEDQLNLGRIKGNPPLFYPNTFWVRQNLCELPFSGTLWGPFMDEYEIGSCAALKKFIWTKWDEVPADVAAALEGKKNINDVRRTIAGYIADDMVALQGFLATGDPRARIVEDRIAAMQAYLPSAALTLEQKEAAKEIGRQLWEVAQYAAANSAD